MSGEEGRHVTRAKTMTTPAGGTFTTFITLTETGRPAAPTDEQEPIHQLDGFCWCQPTVEPDTAGMPLRYIHRQSLDVPHVETVELGFDGSKR